MTFLPIVARELRVASRRRSTYWSRAASATGAILVGIIMQAMARDSAPHEFGENLFGVLAWISIFYCLFSGVRATSDCLSEEKREGTLGLLFLTDLKGYDVILGKLFATSVGAFYGLLAIFPVLAVPLLLGGVTNGEFWRMALVLVNTFLFSLAIGMAASSISKSARKSMAATFLLILFFTAGLPACVVWIPELANSKEWSKAFMLPCPFTSFQLSFDAAFKAEPDRFWWSLGWIHGLTWAFLVLASVVVPQSWQDKPAGSRAVRWRDSWRKWSYGDALERNSFRKRLLDVNAFYWLAGRARLKPAHVWAFLAVVACFWAWGCIEVGKDWFNPVTYTMTGIVLNTGLKLWVASEAGRRLGEDRKMGSLELLLSTPLGVRDILRGQMLALRRQFLLPTLVVIGIELVFMVASVQKDPYQSDSAYVLFWLAYIFMLMADIVAVSWVGMWVALTVKNPNRATGITVVRLLVFPWVMIAGIMILMSLMAIASSAFDASGLMFLALWFGVGILTDFTFAMSARRNLLNNFRLVAMKRYAAPRGLLRRLFGDLPKTAA